MRGTWRLKQLAGRWRAHRDLVRARAAVAEFPRLTTKLPAKLGTDLVISLTSYPARFPTLALTLRSLLDQTVAVRRTVLWVAHQDAASLPRDVTQLQDHGLQIRTCEDLRSYKKLIPALQEWPEAAIITADDDLYYAPDWAEGLIAAAREQPGKVIGRRMHLALLDAHGRMAPYTTWVHASERHDDDLPRGVLFPTGVGGVLYPPGGLDPRVTDVATFMELCPSADDVWFFWMAKLAGSGHRGLGDTSALTTWDGSQDEGLLHENLAGGGNDRQIAAMTARFGQPWMGSTADRAATVVAE